MKTLSDILKKKRAEGESVERIGIDDKTTCRVFLEMAKEEIPNLENGDIREMEIRQNIMYIKTAHPTVSSELFLRRKKILQKANEILGRGKIEKMIVG